MKKRIYLVKTDPAAIGNDIEWLQMSGKEFAAFCRTPEGKGRYFIRLTDDISFEAPEIIIETNREEYIKWKRGQDRRDYLNKQSKQYITLSLDADLINGHSLLDSIITDEEGLEEMVVNLLEQKKLIAAIDSLSNDEKRVISIMFFDDVHHTEEETAKALGMSKSALHRRKVKIFQKIAEIMRTKF